MLKTKCDCQFLKIKFFIGVNCDVAEIDATLLKTQQKIVTWRISAE